nr:Unknown Function [uncultured bacterium]
MSPEARSGNTSIIDSPVVPERVYRRLVKTIAISGEDHTGKTAISTALAKVLGVSVYNGQGEFGRRTGSESGKEDRSLATHKKFDRRQRRYFRKYTPDTARIHETRLAGITLAEVRDERDRIETERRWKAQRSQIPTPETPEIPAISVLILSNKESRVKRAYLESLSKNEGLKKAEIEQKVSSRSYDNFEIWKAIHQNYISDEKNPFDPNLKRSNGSPVYDIVIYNNDMENVPAEAAVEQAVMQLISRLDSFGAFAHPTPIQLGEPFETARQTA